MQSGFEVKKKTKRTWKLCVGLSKKICDIGLNLFTKLRYEDFDFLKPYCTTTISRHHKKLKFSEYNNVLNYEHCLPMHKSLGWPQGLGHRPIIKCQIKPLKWWWRQGDIQGIKDTKADVTGKFEYRT